MSGYHLCFSVFFVILSVTDAAIIPEVATYNANVNKDFTLPWEYDNETEMFTVDWSYKSFSATLATNIMSQDQGASAVPLKDNVEHIRNGNIKLLSVKKQDEGIYYCAVTYDVSSGLSLVTGTATLSVIDDDGNNKVEIIVGSLLGVLAGVGCTVGVVFLIWKYKCKKKKQQPCETERGESKKVSQKKEKGDTKNRTPRPQPTPPVKPLENREESGSAVSREDVDLQDHSNKLHKRPMPNIPRSKDKDLDFHYNGHDNKGRGLSANFDDNFHPMTTVGIPEKKAGALEPLDEAAGEQAPKKLKKNKKKRLEDDDQF